MIKASRTYLLFIPLLLLIFLLLPFFSSLFLSLLSRLASFYYYHCFIFSITSFLRSLLPFLNSFPHFSFFLPLYRSPTPPLSSPFLLARVTSPAPPPCLCFNFPSSSSSSSFFSLPPRLVPGSAHLSLLFQLFLISSLHFPKSSAPTPPFGFSSPSSTRVSSPAAPPLFSGSLTGDHQEEGSLILSCNICLVFLCSRADLKLPHCHEEVVGRSSGSGPLSAFS